MKSFFLLTTLVCASAANANGDCTLALSPSSVSYEARTLNMLQVSGHGAALSFGERRVRLSVDCPRMQALEVRFDAPAASRDTYRFGPGELQLRVVSARLDGRMIEWSREPDGVRNASLLRPGDRLRRGSCGPCPNRETHPLPRAIGQRPRRGPAPDRFAEPAGTDWSRVPGRSWSVRSPPPLPA